MSMKYNDKGKEWARAYYQANKDRIKEYQSLYRKSGPQGRRPIGDHRNRLLQYARQRAQLRGLEFSITKHDITIPEFCPYLNVKLEVNTEYAPSIDRIDSSKGYVPGNVEVISKRANTLKSNATYEELLLIAERMKPVG